MRRKAGTAFGWFGAFFLAAQVALALAMDRWPSELRDPEFGRKLRLLHQRLAEHPDRPLLLMLGSSRTLQGFQPQRFEGLTSPDGRLVLPFNFGLTGVGPLKELACLHRLRQDGVPPALLLIEVLPALLNEPGPLRLSEEIWLNGAMLSADDVALLRPYHTQPNWLLITWARARLLPWYSARSLVMQAWAAKWVPAPLSLAPLGEMDRAGWQPFGHEQITAEERRRLMDEVHTQYGFGTRHFHIADGPRRALCDLLELCRQEGIRVMLVLMPESSEFRSWYSPGMKTEFPEFLRQLRERYGVPIIDARAWIADEEFWDGHHLMPHGASRFTERFRDAVRREWR